MKDVFGRDAVGLFTRPDASGVSVQAGFRIAPAPSLSELDLDEEREFECLREGDEEAESFRLFLERELEREE